jgi:hypothetical protein
MLHAQERRSAVGKPWQLRTFSPPVVGVSLGTAKARFKVLKKRIYPATARSESAGWGRDNLQALTERGMRKTFTSQNPRARAVLVDDTRGLAIMMAAAEFFLLLHIQPCNIEMGSGLLPTLPGSPLEGAGIGTGDGVRQSNSLSIPF